MLQTLCLIRRSVFVYFFVFLFVCFFGVVVRYKRLEPKIPGSSPTQYLVFFPSVLL